MQDVLTVKLPSVFLDGIAEQLREVFRFALEQRYESLEVFRCE
jgi:hypothetical protein